MTGTDLPIWEQHAAIVGAVREAGRLVLTAPTGSGKSTQVPAMILDAGLAGSGRVIVLEPRRVAARTLAARVAHERGVRLGGEVGYQVRFDDRTSLGTRLCYVTEGILLRWLLDDPRLAGVGAVVLDEFHERNLNSDLALALLKTLQLGTRPDLRLVVMSATLDAAAVAAYLDSSPLVQSEGRAWPVEVTYLEHPDRRPPAEVASDAVRQIVLGSAPGDILVFMPGMAEINATLRAVRDLRLPEPLTALPLHGDLPAEAQDAAFALSDRRKVVVATNVAETSVTIPGIRAVVDSGLARVSRYDPERGVGTLFVEPISRASADQRAGRAGRTGPGVCHRLWTQNSQLNRPVRTTPEIQRADLAEVVLLLHSFGVRRAAEFDWLDRPESAAVDRAERLLVTLGALTSPGVAGGDSPSSDLTPIGREMLELPMHPRYARMLVEARRRGCVDEAALCAALVSGRDLLVRAARNDPRVAEAQDAFTVSTESDFLVLMRAWEFARDCRFDLEACRAQGIHAQTAREVGETAHQFRRLAGGGSGALPAAPDALLRCLTAGFVDQLGVRRDAGTLDCELTEGRRGVLARESVVQKAPLLAAASLREVEGKGGSMTLLGLATAVRPEWLEELFPQHLATRIEHDYDALHKRVSALRVTRFLGLAIERRHEREPDPAAAGQCLAEAHQRGAFELPGFSHDLRQFVGRVNLAAAVLPELDLPPFDEPAVVAALARAFRGLTLARDAQAAPLAPALRAHLAAEQQAWLDELCPVRIAWPDDRPRKLLYADPAVDRAGHPAPPEFDVKLHECFARKEHPRLCEGRLPVRVWLCAPDGKRLEATTDWPAFRAHSYPKLKLGLQRKHPGVTWV